MRIVAYLYSDPLLEETPDPSIWGWELDRIYQDLALRPDTEKEKSRRPSPEPRPQWKQLMQDIQIEPIDFLLIRRLEELGDSVQEVGDRLSELATEQIQLIAVEQEPLPNSTPDSDFSSTADPTRNSLPNHLTVIPGTALQADLLKLLQQLQHNQRSRRLRQTYAHNRVKTLPPPGKAPYGYRRGKTHYILDRATAPIVKDFFEHFLLYGSVRGAVRYLAKKYNKRIAVSTGHRWLTNPVYRGDLEYQTGDIIPDTHTPILSRDEAAQVDRLLRRNRRLPPRTASAPRSLAGLVVCGQCRSPMTVTRVAPSRNTRKGATAPAQEYLYLRPTACTNQPKCRAIAYEKILEQTIAQICEELPRAVAEVGTPDIDRIQQGIGGTIASKQEILAQLPPLVETGVLDQATADLRAYKLRTEIAELQTNLAQLPPVNLRSIAQAVSIPQFWLDLSETERRFYFREFLRQIELVRSGQEWVLKLVFIF